MNMFVSTAIAGTAFTSATSAATDPIFAAIEDHGNAQAALTDKYTKLDDAEYEAKKEHGCCPVALIHWRGYHIGGSEIEGRREQLLQEQEIDSATVEQEYLEAKASYQAKVAAAEAWDVRAGLVTGRQELDRAINAANESAERLSRTKPTTPAGAAALIQHVIDDDICNEIGWHMAALDTAVAALNKMTRGAAS